MKKLILLFLSFLLVNSVFADSYTLATRPYDRSGNTTYYVFYDGNYITENTMANNYCPTLFSTTYGTGNALENGGFYCFTNVLLGIQYNTNYVENTATGYYYLSIKPNELYVVGGSGTGNLNPPTPPVNQTKPADYIPCVDNTDYIYTLGVLSGVNEYDGQGNCLYTNPDTSLYDKPLQYCKASDYQLGIYDFYCPEGKAYINYISQGDPLGFVRSMVCATGNNESAIVSVQTSSVNKEPFISFPSLNNIVSTQGSGNTIFSIVKTIGLVQNYSSEFVASNNYVVNPTFLQQTYPIMKKGQSVIGAKSSQSSTNTSGNNYNYYIDFEYYNCMKNSTFLNPCLMLFSANIYQLWGHPEVYENTLLTEDIDLASVISDTGSLTLSGTFCEGCVIQGTTPINQIPKEIDNSIFNCTFSPDSWYEYFGSPFICGFQIARNVYLKGSMFVQNVGAFINNIFNIGSDRSGTKGFFSFGIERAEALSGTVDLGRDLLSGMESVDNGEGLFGKIYKFFWYAIYSMVFFIILAYFLTKKR